MQTNRSKRGYKIGDTNFMVKKIRIYKFNNHNKNILLNLFDELL